MHNEFLYVIAFIVANAWILFLYPYELGLDESVAAQRPFRNLDVKSVIYRRRRFRLAAASIILFSIFTFAGQAEIAMIFGFCITGSIVYFDYKSIKRDVQNQ